MDVDLTLRLIQIGEGKLVHFQALQLYHCRRWLTKGASEERDKQADDLKLSFKTHLFFINDLIFHWNI